MDILNLAKKQIGFIFKSLNEFGKALGSKLDTNNEDNEQISTELHLEEIWQAQKEWETAVNNFNYVNDKDLIDISIYNMETSMKKYVYLLNKARNEGFYNDALKSMEGNSFLLEDAEKKTNKVESALR